MKRINNRGVVLLETLVVSVFVLTISVFIYRNAVPLMGHYEKLEDFDDVDSVYSANLVKNMVISDIGFDTINNVLLKDDVYYYDISDCNKMIDESTSLYSDKMYCSELKKRLHINNDDFIYITKYSGIGLNKFRDAVNDGYAGKASNTVHPKFKDYLKTVSNGEAFYSKKFYATGEDIANISVSGHFRVFISRTVEVPDLDADTGIRNVKKYANIGIYKKDN